VKYLVDAKVLSESTKPAPDLRVVARLRVSTACRRSVHRLSHVSRKPAIGSMSLARCAGTKISRNG
jgi:hypothetical protein